MKDWARYLELKCMKINLFSRKNGPINVHRAIQQRRPKKFPSNLKIANKVELKRQLA